MKTDELREKYLAFFESKGHTRKPSDVLVPTWDPSVLFTPAGMNQFKDHFLGKVKLDFMRATTCQKCLRTGDIDNVGRTAYHHTFFEMLGNFSFGDYFKRDAIPFAWTLLTEVWGLDPGRLFPTIFKGEASVPRDDEAFEIWKRVVPAERIGELDAGDNFWSMVDTGRGLERITAVIQGKLSNYDTDLFTPILSAIAAKAGLAYTASVDAASDVSMRVVADHLRAMTFLISDGVVPSNEWRGYVLRKIMRRAMRHGKKLGYTEPVLHQLVNTVVEEMGDAYPELVTNRDSIVRVVRSEEERFDAVLTAGLPRLEDVLDRAAGGNRIVPGEEAFKLYDSLGMPLDFIEDLAGQRGLALDREGYEREMEGQRVKARAGSSFKTAEKGLAFTLTPELEKAFDAAGDIFEGYEATRVPGVPVLALCRRPVHRTRRWIAGLCCDRKNALLR